MAAASRPPITHIGEPPGPPSSPGPGRPIPRTSPDGAAFTRRSTDLVPRLNVSTSANRSGRLAPHVIEYSVPTQAAGHSKDALQRPRQIRGDIGIRPSAVAQPQQVNGGLRDGDRQLPGLAGKRLLPDAADARRNG
jgi:hypothetical protein